MRFDELPPLAFLPTLEAAGRLGSFKAAADELHITPSAVSQQVKAVEDALGSALFERRGRTVLLTTDGERYLREVRQALRTLATAGQRLRNSRDRNVLRLDTVPFVAHEFLLPRLSELRARFPTVEFVFETNSKLTDIETSDVDAAIRFGGGPWAGLTNRLIGALDLTVVCAPSLAREIHSLADLAHHNILEMRGHQERGIANALMGMGIPVDPSRVHSFESYFETVRAAEHGAGVAYGFFPLTTHWVTAGRLAVPLDLRFLLPGFVCLVHRHGDDARFPFEELSAWLKEEYEALPALPPGRLMPDEPSPALQIRSR